MNKKLLNNICMFGGAIFILLGILFAMNGFIMVSYILVSIGIVLESVTKLIAVIDSRKNGESITKDALFLIIYLVLLIFIWVI